jgi:hypothetical protein
MIGVTLKVQELKTREEYVATLRALVLDPRVKLEINDEKKDVVLCVLGPSSAVINKTKKLLAKLAIDHGGILKLR